MNPDRQGVEHRGEDVRQGVEHRGEDVRQDDAQPGARGLLDAERQRAKEKPGNEGEETFHSQDACDQDG